jgi:hypothetical protein
MRNCNVQYFSFNTSFLLSLSSFKTVILPFLSPVARKSPFKLYSRAVIES